ncbi:MAG: hypothetical protein VZQ80_11820, partial [Lachnospiraceae bacterium]|nr:hypothetical protein [Lachnospiraceae bacterium]
MKFGKKLLTCILATATILSPFGALRTEAAPQTETIEAKQFTVAGAPRDSSAPQYMGIDVSKWQNSPKKNPATGET